MRRKRKNSRRYFARLAIMAPRALFLVAFGIFSLVAVTAVLLNGSSFDNRSRAYDGQPCKSNVECGYGEYCNLQIFQCKKTDTLPSPSPDLVQCCVPNSTNGRTTLEYVSPQLCTLQGEAVSSNMWLCGNECAKANTRTLFNQTWCNGQSRWKYEAHNNGASCTDGTQSRLITNGCSYESCTPSNTCKTDRNRWCSSNNSLTTRYCTSAIVNCVEPEGTVNDEACIPGEYAAEYGPHRCIEGTFYPDAACPSN